MQRDIEDLLQRAAGPPADVPPLDKTWRAGRRRMWRDRTVVAVGALAAAGLIVTGPLPSLREADAPPATEGSADICRQDQHGCVEVSAGEPIVLGTLLAISGENAALGLDSQHGAVLAADLRDNRVVGHPVEWVHQDDRCSPEGRIGARALGSDARIVAVIGTSCSVAAHGVADAILNDRGIVLFSPSNTSPALTDPSTHQPFYLRVAHNDGIQGAAMVDFAINELGATSAATIHDGSPYGEVLAAVFAEQFQAAGGRITAHESVRVGEEDMRPVLTSIAQTEPDLIYYPVFVEEGALITSQARELGALNGVALAGSDGMLTPDWLRAAGRDNAEGVYLSGPDFRIKTDIYNQTVLPEYRKRWGEPTSVFHAHAFDATNLVLDAIERVAVTDPSTGTTYIPRTALKDHLLLTSGYAGAVGTLTCDNNGDCNPGASVQINVVRDGEFVTVYSASPNGDQSRN
jgi:branched-chain amino acid transport system substrate-binding protein